MAQKNIADLLSTQRKERGRLVSIVLPLYNEEESLPIVINELFEYLPTALPQYNFEVTFIDDCSTDNSYFVVKEAARNSPSNVKLTVAQLSKNSGSHVAITAGMNMARGEFVIIMASDGQDPAAVISQLIAQWEAGNQLILASRFDNLDQGTISKRISKLAWKLMNWSTNIQMPETGCDLLGMDKMVADSFNKMDERNTTFIFRILSLGFKQKEIQYTKRVRAGGKSKWTFFKKLSIMFDAISGFSNRPLMLITNIGLIVFVILLIRWIFVVYKIYVLKEEPTDVSIILNTIFSALAFQVLLLGVIGDYIWRILDETRKRPIYEIAKIDGEVFED